MEAADTDRQARDEEGAGEVDGTGKLVGLHTDQPNEPAAAAPADHADDAVRADAAVGLVVCSRISTSGPSTCRCLASSASPLRHASVLEGRAERTHWIG